MTQFTPEIVGEPTREITQIGAGKKLDFEETEENSKVLNQKEPNQDEILPKNSQVELKKSQIGNEKVETGTLSEKPAENSSLENENSVIDLLKSSDLETAMSNPVKISEQELNKKIAASKKRKIDLDIPPPPFLSKVSKLRFE